MYYLLNAIPIIINFILFPIWLISGSEVWYDGLCYHLSYSFNLIVVPLYLIIVNTYFVFKKRKGFWLSGLVQLIVVFCSMTLFYFAMYTTFNGNLRHQYGYSNMSFGDFIFWDALIPVSIILTVFIFWGMILITRKTNIDDTAKKKILNFCLSYILLCASYVSFGIAGALFNLIVDTKRRIIYNVIDLLAFIVFFCISIILGSHWKKKNIAKIGYITINLIGAVAIAYDTIKFGYITFDDFELNVIHILWYICICIMDVFPVIYSLAITAPMLWKRKTKERKNDNPPELTEMAE